MGPEGNHTFINVSVNNRLDVELSDNLLITEPYQAIPVVSMLRTNCLTEAQLFPIPRTEGCFSDDLHQNIANNIKGKDTLWRYEYYRTVSTALHQKAEGIMLV